MASLSSFDTDQQFQAKVISSTRYSPDDSEEIRELTLEVDREGFEYKVGQSIGVLVKTDKNYGSSEHHRLYSISDIPDNTKEKPLIKILVKRCSYVDEFSGERVDGVASHYLCDLQIDETVTLTGPFGLPFIVPEEKDADLLLIGLGTGIAPFRAFVKHLYEEVKEWKGRVRLFHGARTGLELIYMNEKNNDFSNYYDQETFQAFEALSPRPHWADPIALDYALEQRSDEILNMLAKPGTHIYVAGHEKIRTLLDDAFVKMLGSKEKWENRKAELVAGKRWAEIIY